MVYRDLAIEIFNKLIDYSLNDSVMYNRLRQLLSQDNKGKNMSKESFDNLATKADKAGIDLLEVIEVYNEGYEQDYPLHLTREQRAFNKVNSFLAELKSSTLSSYVDKARKSRKEAIKNDDETRADQRTQGIADAKQRLSGSMNTKKKYQMEDNEFGGVYDSSTTDREQGTTSLTNLYKKGTPGQSKTLKTLKKVAKK